jgi:hypothetical protein
VLIWEVNSEEIFEWVGIVDVMVVVERVALIVVELEGR